MSLRKYYSARRTYLNILLVIMVSILLLLLALAATLYFRFAKTGTQIINSANIDILTQMSNSLNYLDSTAKDFGVSMLLNNDAKMLMYNNDDIKVAANSFDKITQIVRSVPYVHSLYIYNSKIDTFYSTFRSPYNSGQFFDQEMKQYLQSGALHTDAPIPRKIPVNNLNDNQYDNVYSYFLYDRSFSESDRKDAVIVNMRADWLSEKITALNPAASKKIKANNTVFIIDKAGNIVNHPNPAYFLRNMSGESYIHRIIANGDPASGFFIDVVEGRKSILTYIKSTQIPDWIFVSITPFEVVSNQLETIQRSTLLIGLAVILLGLLVSLLLSKLSYRPIHRIAQSLLAHNEPESDSKEQMDEITFIATAIEQNSIKTRSLEAYKKRSFELFKNETIKRMLFDSALPLKDKVSQCKEYDIPLSPEQPLRLLILKIDHWTEFADKFDERDRQLMRLGIVNISEEILSEYYTCKCIDSGNDHIIALLNVAGAQAELQRFGEDLLPRLQRIQDSSERYLKLSLSLVISRHRTSMADIHTLYKETLDISNYRLLFGHKCIIDANLVQSSATGPYQYPVDKQSELLEELRLGRTQAVNELFLLMAQEFRSFSYSNIILSYTILAANVFNTLNMMERNGIGRFQLDFHTFNSSINDAETIEEIHGRFFSLFNDINGTINAARNNKNKLLADSVISIILDNYADINLSMDAIADKVKISPNHLGKIFKEQTTYSLGDYMMNVRLAKVTELLAGSSLTVNDIADKTGFYSPKYLFKVFKKHYGVTPGEYRLNHSIKGIGSKSENS